MIGKQFIPARIENPTRGDLGRLLANLRDTRPDITRVEVLRMVDVFYPQQETQVERATCAVNRCTVSPVEFNRATGYFFCAKHMPGDSHKRGGEK